MPLTLILSPEGIGKGEGDIRKFHELARGHLLYVFYSTKRFVK
jgi:hypothetical protein